MTSANVARIIERLAVVEQKVRDLSTVLWAIALPVWGCIVGFLWDLVKTKEVGP